MPSFQRAVAMDTTASGRSHKEHTSLLSAVFFPRLFEAFLEHSDSGRGEIMHIYKTETEGDRQAGLETVKEGEND